MDEPRSFRWTILAIRVSPKKHQSDFASSSSGIFRSRDRGVTWTRLDIEGGNHFPGALILRIHPKNPGVIYAAGSQFFESSDEGQTWKVLFVPAAEDTVTDFEFHPTNRLIVYAVTVHSGVLKSVDGGITWTRKNRGLNPKPVKQCCDNSQIEINPKNPENLFVFLMSRKVFRSDNGGESWRNVSTGLKFGPSIEGHALLLDERDPNVLYLGGWLGIYKTTNGGGKWFDTKCRCGVWSLAQDPRNASILFGGEASTNLMKSTDAGATWNRSVTPAGESGGILGVGVHPKIRNFLLAGTFGSGLMRSLDGGKSFAFVNNGLNATQISFLVPVPQRKGFLYALQAPNVYFSTNSGLTWKPDLSLGPFFVNSIAVHPQNPNLRSIVADGVAASTDGGKTWKQNPLPGVNTHVRPVLHFHSQNNTLYLAPSLSNGSGNWEDDTYLGVQKSTDLGVTWKSINSGLTDKEVWSLLVDPKDGDRLFVGTLNARIFVSTNGGKNWKSISTGLSGSEIHSIAIDPKDRQIIYAANREAIFKTTNGGKEWIRKNQKGNQFLAIDAQNSQTLYTGGFGTIFISTDGAETFSVFDSSGLAPFPVNTLVNNPFDDRSLFLGTGHGVFSFTRVSAANSPVINQLSPSIGKPGDAITVLGQNFGTTQGNSIIQFNGVTAQTSSWSDTQVSVTVPSDAQTGPVVIKSDNRKSNPHEFIVLPTSGNLAPESGPSSGETRVTLIVPREFAGTQFNIVFGNNLASELRFVEPNVVLCTAPSGNGTVEVSIVSTTISSLIGSYIYQ